MPIDTKDFDDKIAALTAQAATAQADVDADTLGAQLNALKAKSDAVKETNDKLSEIKGKKEKAIFLQDRIDADTLELTSLLDSMKV